MIPRTNVFDAAEEAVMNQTNTPFHLRRSAFRSAVNEGLYLKNLPQVAWDCPSGNCTFADEVTTLGYCSRCSDISNLVIREEFRLPRSNLTARQAGAQFLNFTLVGHPSGSEYQNVTLTVPSSASERSRMSSYNQLDGIVGTRRLASAIEFTYWAESNDDPEIRMVRVYEDPAAPNGFQARAFNCSFQPCLRAMTSIVSNGRLDERNNENPEPLELGLRTGPIGRPFYVAADLNCLKEPKKQVSVLRALGYNIRNSTRWLSYNVTVVSFSDSLNQFLEVDTLYSRARNNTLDPIPPAMRQFYTNEDIANPEMFNLTKEALEIVPRECIYQFAYNTNQMINSVWWDLFQGDVRERKFDLVGASSTAFEGSSSLLALYEAGSGNGTLADITQTMGNIAESLTTYIRMNGNPAYSQPQTGISLRNTTCIRVRWHWAIYLLVLVGLLLIFLVMALIKARIAQSHLKRTSSTEQGKPTYHDIKSSLLPVIFHGLESKESIPYVDARNRMKDLETIAENTRVQFIPTSEGWKMGVVDWKAENA